VPRFSICVEDEGSCWKVANSHRIWLDYKTSLARRKILRERKQRPDEISICGSKGLSKVRGRKSFWRAQNDGLIKREQEMVDSYACTPARGGVCER